MHRIGIRDLTIYLVILVVAVTASDRFGLIPALGHLPGGSIPAGQWWQLFFYPFNFAQSLGRSLLVLLIYVYMLWAFGTMLEGAIGHAWYTLLLGLTVVAITLGTLLTPATVPATYIMFAILLGVALVAPNQEILLFFILPVRLKWVGLMLGLYLVGSASLVAFTSGSAVPLLVPALGLLGILVFALVRVIGGAGQRIARDRRVQRIRPVAKSIHRCTICGITETDDPHMDFRYCVGCSDHEYCSRHLHDHEHVIG